MTDYPEPSSSNQHLLSLIAGIIAIVFGLIGSVMCQLLAPLGLIAGGTAIWMGYRAMNDPDVQPSDRTLAIVGLVTGAIGSIFSLIGTVLLVLWCCFLGLYVCCVGGAVFMSALQ